jgi:lipid-A-disaccharide synthase-like uncharacterized protein
VAFSWRTLLQWVLSERARKTLIPRTYWRWSLVGAVLTLVYAVGREDPVFVLGALATGGIFARNAWLGARRATDAPPPPPAVWPLAAGIALFAALAALDALGEASAVRTEPWAVLGFVGQFAWSGRFAVQWLESERRGRSVLPASFFVLGVVGSVLLTVYAVERRDWVNVLAYVFNPVPYGRNWLLLAREARTLRAAAPPSLDDAADVLPPVFESAE